jgi:hypothetical protein
VKGPKLTNALLSVNEASVPVVSLQRVHTVVCLHRGIGAQLAKLAIVQVLLPPLQLYGPL